MRTGFIRLNGLSLEYRISEASIPHGWRVWARSSAMHEWTQLGVGDGVFDTEQAAVSRLKHVAAELNAGRLKI